MLVPGFPRVMQRWNKARPGLTLPIGVTFPQLSVALRQKTPVVLAAEAMAVLPIIPEVVLSCIVPLGGNHGGSESDCARCRLYRGGRLL